KLDPFVAASRRTGDMWIGCIYCVGGCLGPRRGIFVAHSALASPVVEPFSSIVTCASPISDDKPLAAVGRRWGGTADDETMRVAFRRFGDAGGGGGISRARWTEWEIATPQALGAASVLPIAPPGYNPNPPACEPMAAGCVPLVLPTGRVV